MITEKQLLRYSRHILLNEVDIAGQEAILAGRILVIGAGGLAHPALTYLVSSGVQHIIIVDNDQIELSNLQRQFWFIDNDIGQYKATILSQRLQQLNRQAQIMPIVAKADITLLQQLSLSVDLVLDCTDNFSTRSLINRICFQQRKPLISASALIFSGQLAVYDFRNGQGPCYQCLFSGEINDQEASCAKHGVFSPLVGIMGSAQASETLQLLAGIHPDGCWIYNFDVRRFQWQNFQLSVNPFCSICNNTMLTSKISG